MDRGVQWELFNIFGQDGKQKEVQVIRDAPGACHALSFGAEIRRNLIYNGDTLV